MVSKYLFRYVFISSICCLIIHPCLTLNATPIFDNLLVLDTNLSSDNADTLVERGNFLFDKKNYSEAIHSYKRALAFSSDNKQQGYILNLIGRSYFRAKDIKNAMEFYERSLQIRRSIKDINGEITSLGNIALVYEIQNNYTKSVEYHLKALSLSKENQELAQQSRALGNLARANYFLGSYAKSLDYYQQALQVRQLLKNTFEQGKSWMGIGLIYHELGEYKRALENYQMALQLFKTSQNKTDDIWTEQGRLLNNIGLTYIRLEKYQEALDYLFQSLALRQKVGDRKGEAKTLTNIGDTYRRIQQYSKSLSMLKKALGIAREIGDMESIAQVLESIATVYQIEQGYVQAFDIYQQALSISKSPYNRASIFSNLGDLFTRWGKVATAIAFYKKSVQTTEAIRQDLTSLPIEQQKSYVETVSYTYRALADLLLSQGRISEAVQVLELLKVKELENYTHDSIRSAVDNNAITILEQEKEILQRFTNLGEFSQKFRECESNKCPDIERYRNDRDNLANQFTEALEQIKRYIAKRITKDEAVLDPNDVRSNRDIRDLLNKEEGTMLIYPFVVEDKIWFVIAISNGNVITVTTRIKEINRKEISKLIIQYLDLLKNSNSDLSELKVKSKALYDVFISPIASEIKDKKIKHLIFSLDQIVRYVPIASLYDGEQYLIENYKISTILSAKLTRIGQPLGEAKKIRILAGGLSNSVAEFAALPNVIAELDGIVKEDRDSDSKGIFTGNKLLDKAFTFEGLRDRLRGNNLLHIATHGKFVTGNREESYLMMGDGKKLLFPNIQTLTDYLGDVQMVVLSACETALGGTDSDGIEIAGMGYYFLNAGAQTVVASLWKVSDRSTSLLMQRFYQNLAGSASQKKQGRAEALRQAQLSLLHSDNESESAKTKSGQVVIEKRSRSNVQNRSKTNFSHPYYWAPFILIGNGL